MWQWDGFFETMMNIMEHVLQVLLLLELERFMEKIYDRICILMVVDVSLVHLVLMISWLLTG